MARRRAEHLYTVTLVVENVPADTPSEACNAVEDAVNKVSLGDVYSCEAECDDSDEPFETDPRD